MKRRIPLYRVLPLLIAPLLNFSPSASAQNNSHTVMPGYVKVKPQEQHSLPGTATKDWINTAQDNITRATYFFSQTTAGQVVLNQKQKIAFETNGAKLVTKPVSMKRSWTSSVELIRIEKGVITDLDNAPPLLKAEDDHLLYTYDGFSVEYLNTEAGLRQNFLITKKPEGVEQLKIHLKIAGDLTPVLLKGSFLQLLDKETQKPFLKYDDLKVWDANNKLLVSHMELGGDNDLQLVVDDADAVYPVTVDPLTHSSEWVTSADGVLPGLLGNLQIDAAYGYNVTGVGDVNGDGYDDVAIGAPVAAQVIAGPTTIAGVGAVFLYFGSAAGLPTTPSRVLRPNTPVANALFGFSVAAGNITGTVKNDIVVGAPGEAYSTSVSGFPTTATVTAGKVYSFSGDDLAAGPATPFASIYLNGSGFFSRGIVSLLLSNINVNALFGFSVSVTEDMNADGFGEIIVGAPGYQGVNLLDVRSGAAFVYFSNNIATNTPVQLNAPSLVGFPGLINLDGLLFGFSVDGAGDYDKDGNPDVVVGAPGGLNLGLSGFLGGSAYIYTSNGSGGIGVNVRTQLTASGPLLGAVANLFGYTVKGVRDITGKRNGNIIVGAPVGNVLSDILGGLRLKTGTLNVFPAKVAPSTNEVPVQSFSSPRSSSLLSILNLQNINVNAMFGASVDNVLDANCDGIPDIIVGEPLSTGVGLIGANAVGGAAYVFTGDGTGKYNTTPYWTLENKVSFDAGINAGSMTGYSVAGAGHTNGPTKSVRALVGAPGAALDFSTGILQLGNTLGTLFSFTSGNNGLGKAYAFGFNCDILVAPDVNVTHINVTVPGNVNTNDLVYTGTTYSTPVPNGSNPAGATINMNADGSYTFVAPLPGVYIYNVPVCIPGIGCQPSVLTITVLDILTKLKPPVANTDIATGFSNTPVILKSLANDAAGDLGGSLSPSSVTIIRNPLHGTATVNPVTGDITYTSVAGYVGTDTVGYSVADNAMTPLTATAIQIVYVRNDSSANTTIASDDYVTVALNTTATGNVKLNDTDPEGDSQSITPQDITISGKGRLILNADGSYTFTPQTGFTGPVSFKYTTNDAGSPQASASATLYILVTLFVNPDLTPTTRISNGTFIEPAGTIRDIVVEVSEIAGNAIDNVDAPVTIRLLKSDNFNYTFDPAAVSANVPSTIVVNNPDWEVVTDNSTTLTLRLKPAKTIGALGFSRILIRFQVLAGAAAGVENQTVTLLNGSGAEVNMNNNSVVRILNIVH